MGNLFNFNKMCKNKSGKVIIPVLVIIVILALIEIGSASVENDVQISGDKEIINEEYLHSGEVNNLIEDNASSGELNNEIEEIESEENIVKDEVKESATEEVEKDFEQLRGEELSRIPAYSNSPYHVVNNNVPFFNTSDLVKNSYEKYGDLDNLRKMH